MSAVLTLLPPGISSFSLQRYFRLALLFIFALSMSFSAGTATQSQIDTAWNKALSWLATYQNGEGRWSTPPGTEMVTTALAADAFRRGNVQQQSYSRAIAWVSNAPAYSTEARARQIVTLYNAGMQVSPAVTSLLDMRNTNNVWGAYAGYAGSFPDTSLVLDVIKTTATSYSGTNTALTFVVNTQNADYGWPYINTVGVANPLPNASSVIPTAYNIATLKRHAVYPTQISNAVIWLKTKQKSNGSFGDGANGTVYETAMAYLALVTAIGTSDPAANSALDYLLSQQAPDGSWSQDAFLTALVLQAIPVHSGTPTVSQNVSTIPSNGSNIGGPATAVYVGMAFTNTNSSFTLSASGGKPPYIWKLVGGSLPTGMSMSSTGQIAGIASTPGRYTFTVQATDMNGAVVATTTYEIIMANMPTTTPGTPLSPAILQLILN